MVLSFFRRSLAALLALAVLAVVAPEVVRPSTANAQQDPVVLINEILADNDLTNVDNTGQFEDWIELFNTTSTAVDIGGWQIADSSDSFVFEPGTVVPGNGYLLVWASGDVTRTTATEIHVPFKLSADGESLVLTDSNGLISSPSWTPPEAFPPQLADNSYGVAIAGEIRYFTNPTPGARNGGGVAGGLIAPVTFSLEHGFYNTSQTLTLDTPSADATIRYTTNGDVPTESVGTQLTPGTSITISETTTIRAVAYADRAITSPVETRSYLFTNDIMQQSGTPDGFPSAPVNGQALDYGMDPNVVNGSAAAVEAALTGIPSISIVTDVDNLFDPTSGIYVNAREQGAAWERQAAVELIDPTGREAGFDIEAGIRIRGGYSRNATNPKHAFRLFFRDDYESELDYALFGAEGDDRFEKLDLRTANNRAWSWTHSELATFIDEVWSRDTQGAMGQPYTRSRPYHVYLNGTYWGLYMSQERLSGSYGESYFGTNEDNFDVVKRATPEHHTEATDGTDTAWKSLFPLVEDAFVDDAEFAQLDAQVDLENLADNYLQHFFAGDGDSSPTWHYFRQFGHFNVSNNWYAVRDRTGSGAGGKWQFFDHDSEATLCSDYGLHAGIGAEADNTPPWNIDTSLGADYMTPAFLHQALVTHPAYVQIFQDRVQLHMLTPGGALTLPEALARLEARVLEVSPAIEAESARWGDGGGEPAFGRSEWNYGVQVKRDCLADRVPIVEAQLREDGMWPLTDAPVMSPASGGIAYGANVTVDANNVAGTLYYALDGVDPRSTDGSVAASAVAYSGPIQITADTTITARVFDGASWSPSVSGSYFLTSAAGPVSLAVNEFNAVSSGNFLGDNGSDATFGRVAGNGGDWIEFVVIEDGLDIRGWTFEIWNEDNGELVRDAALTLRSQDVFNGLAAGSLLTISEDIADDISYSPLTGDWHMNVQSNDATAGAHVTAASQSNFAINNDDTQIAIFDADGVPVQLRTGEGTVPDVSVSSSEVFKLEARPTTAITPQSMTYNDGTSSTWGLPNVWSAGTVEQDLGRISFGDVNCDGRASIADAVFAAQLSVSIREGVSSCDGFNQVTHAMAPAADVNASNSVTIADAILIAQCAASITNAFCPTGLP